jgi:DNA polymerase-3 subunit beta
MEFEIEREEFAKGLSRIQNVVEKKGTMPILLNVLIETNEKGVSITGTDLEIALKSFHPAEKLKEGRTTLSAKKLYEVIKELPEKKVSLKVKENHWVEIISGRSNFNIMGLAADSFPSLPVFEEETFVVAEGKTLKEMIERTIFAVSSDESRYNLTGVLFSQKTEGEEKALKMVATDGYRLSIIERPFSAEVKGLEKGILLPKKGLVEFSKLLEEGKDEVWIKLKDAEFPDYRQVIPQKIKKHIRMKRIQLLEALRRVSILSSEKTRGVKFIFSKDILNLSSYNPELGEAKEEVPIEYKGEEITIGFNSRFVLEVLNILNSEEIILELEDSVSPGIIQPAEDKKHTCVVMPMRI